MSSRALSLIYLVYNEEATLASVLDEAVAFCSERPVGWQLVVVNDGSSDRSAEIADAYAARFPQICVVHHPENRGMGGAMASGIMRARMESFVILSADGQAPVDAIGGMLAVADRADIVTTVYERARPPGRQVLSQGLRLLMRATVGIDFRLEGLYLFPTAVAQALVSQISAQTFFFSFELIHRGLEAGLTLTETTMRYEERRAGASKVANLRRMGRVAREVARYALARKLRTA